MTLPTSPASCDSVRGECRTKDRQLQRILEFPLNFVDSPEFHGPHAERVILGRPSNENRPSQFPRPPVGTPPYLASLYQTALLTPQKERFLFRRYNYLKYLAAKLRELLDPERPSQTLMQEIEDHFANAVETRNQIIEANLRLVVALAKSRVTETSSLSDLISDGNVTLMRAVEGFDYSLGNRFSTYASWAIIRTFATVAATASRERFRFRSGMEDAMYALADRNGRKPDSPRIESKWERRIGEILGQLNDREKHIVVRRFGLKGTGRRQTLKALGDELGISKERVRQLEHGAIEKLRSVVTESV